jgi:predicted PurR-regulated permease PerM
MTRSHDEEARRWSTVMLVVLVIVLSFAIGILFRQVSSLRGSVDRITTTVERIEASSTRTETAANELVDFVNEIKAQQQPCATTTTQATTTTACQPPSDDRTQQAVQTIIDVLCASSDPVREKACAELTHGG